MYGPTGRRDIRGGRETVTRSSQAGSDPSSVREACGGSLAGTTRRDRILRRLHWRMRSSSVWQAMTRLDCIPISDAAEERADEFGCGSHAGECVSRTYGAESVETTA